MLSVVICETTDFYTNKLTSNVIQSADSQRDVSNLENTFLITESEDPKISRIKTHHLTGLLSSSLHLPSSKHKLISF
jgi:hypothetical protein